MIEPIWPDFLEISISYFAQKSTPPLQQQQKDHHYVVIKTWLTDTLGQLSSPFAYLRQLHLSLLTLLVNEILSDSLKGLRKRGNAKLFAQRYIMKFARRIPIVRWKIVLRLDLTTTALKRLLAAIQQLQKNDAQRKMLDENARRI